MSGNPGSKSECQNGLDLREISRRAVNPVADSKTNLLNRGLFYRYMGVKMMIRVEKVTAKHDRNRNQHTDHRQHF